MREALQRKILAFIAEPHAHDFDQLAFELVHYQATSLRAYGRLVEARGGLGADWRSAPLVPTDLFRELDLCSHVGASHAVTEFKTSGTTTGRRGVRRVYDLTLYHAGMMAPFVEHVLAGERTPRPWLSLVPDPADDPASSLSHMVGAIADQLAEHVTWVMTPEGLDVERACALARASTEPLIIMTTAFALLHWLDGASEASMQLPAGSRMMLTGGFKGRARSVEEPELLALVKARLGLNPDAVVPEYGMTELTSQAYGRPFQAPPWLRLRVVDPEDGADLPCGEVGLVAFFDLLNLDNVSALVTGDLGRLDASGRLTLLGRAPGALLRGCSLSAEELGVMASS